MKTIASLSLDLDNKWSYMKTHGDAGWEEFPSYLDIVVPRILEFLNARNLKITFFIVGQDADLKKNRDAIASIADAGHEIGNHSFNHEPWLHLYSKEDLVEEFENTETALCNLTGKRPTGFRGPGYSLSPTVLEVLIERGYKYDCSTLPTYIGPFARAYYFFKSPKMADEERDKRKKLFGKLSDGFHSLKPRIMNISGQDLVEIPVTTFPIIKTPIHLSYLLYISTYSRKAALLYWRFALMMCRATGVQPSLLLHPLDFLCGNDVKELSFFPGMEMSLENKLSTVSDILAIYTEHFNVVSMSEHALTIQHTLRSTTTETSVISELT